MDETLYFSYFVGAITGLLQVGIGVVLLAFLFPRLPFAKRIVSYCKEGAFLYGTLLALSGVVGSLIYSEVIGLLPLRALLVAKSLFISASCDFGSGRCFGR